jgi:hypothetical protein
MWVRTHHRREGRRGPVAASIRMDTRQPYKPEEATRAIPGGSEAFSFFCRKFHRGWVSVTFPILYVMF